MEPPADRNTAATPAADAHAEGATAENGMPAPSTRSTMAPPAALTSRYASASKRASDTASEGS